MSLTKTLSELVHQHVTQGDPAEQAAITQTLAWLESLDLSAALAEGDRAPDFELPDLFGVPLETRLLRQRNKLLVVFFRGVWCPYCAEQLRALEAVVDAINATGTRLIALSPEKPSATLEFRQKAMLRYDVLTDRDCAVARKFGVGLDIPSEYQPGMRGFNALMTDSNADCSACMPVTSSFVIGHDGVIIWRWLDPSFRLRPDPEDVLAVLQKRR